MGGVPIPVVFPVPSVDSAFDEAGNPLDSRLESRRANSWTSCSGTPGRRECAMREPARGY